MSAREAFRSQFHWVDGHADLWGAFADAETFAIVVDALVEPWQDARVTHVAGVESRGFLLGGACALRLGAGFVPVRKEGGLLPGATLRTEAGPDYRGRRHRLSMQPRLGAGHRVLLVDDWAERGSQAAAARALVERSGAAYLGLTVVVDQLAEASREALAPVTAILRAEELGS